MVIVKRRWLIVKLDSAGISTVLVPDDSNKSMRFDRLASALEWVNKQPKQKEGIRLMPLEVRG